PARRKAFQNLNEGSDLWSAGGGRAYSATLNAPESAELLRLFQQRHLLAHCQCIVDADYLKKSGDSSYAVGQRIVVRHAAVIRMLELLDRLVSGLRHDLP